MTLRVFMLLGGFFGKDGWITSAPFLGLRSQITAAFPETRVDVDTWDDWLDIYDKIAVCPSPVKTALIGYSGGGSRATWVANQKMMVRIDLMVLYDPSPQWQMKDLTNTKVGKCLQYHNTMPLMFGLGSGLTKGPQVATIDIAQQHAFVQSNQALHDRTIAALRELVNAGL